MLEYSIKKFLILVLLLMSTYAYSNGNEATLTIESNKSNFSFSRSNILAMKNITHVLMSNNRAYPGIEINYTVIKLCDLLKPYSIDPTDMLEFIAADKFSVLIPANKVMSCDKNSAIGYLAIEPAEKWPVLNNKTNTTAGPFDVIWVNPEKSYISNEYWAWSVIKITIHKMLDPKVFMTMPITRDVHIKNGFNVYISHCAGCHTINNVGKGMIGPDLNIPKNPVEYYPNDITLKKFIRDPQSVRIIKNDRMSGSGEDFLNNSDLNDLISYFHYMVKHKK